jgi:hypothetical protein
MEQFPHLIFKQKIIGKPRLYGMAKPNEITIKNKENRQSHRDQLFSKTSSIKEKWNSEITERENLNLVPLDKDVIPVFLQLNPSLLTSDFDLRNLGIEIISEEDDGYILGASLDGLRTLEEKINEFVAATRGTAVVADLWQIIDGHRNEWKPQHILSEELYKKWSDIVDDDIYTLEVSVAFDKPIGERPDPTKQGGLARLRRYDDLLDIRDDKRRERETHFEQFINSYGKITSSLVDLNDSFGCEVEISGRGLKDLVFNYAFVFEVSEKEEIKGINSIDGINADFDLEVLPPDIDSTEVVVIDSGVMEGHKYIVPALNALKSKSYILDNSSTADKVKGGGHGTKVTGAILYPNGITQLTSPYQLPCFIRNIRVLNDDNFLETRFPAELMQTIVRENMDCQIFNLSVNSPIPFRKKHMSIWAATIDNLINERNVLFVISAGNVTRNDIRAFISGGVAYPDYLRLPSCRLANPAQSCFALTVGSINHGSYEDENWKSLGVESDISAFSRIGTGIWNQIKPDVVEFGGGLIVSKDGHALVKGNEITAPELLHSTLHGGGAYGKDSVGTSFATPKVTHIVAQLKNLYPDENVNLLRALVVQGARLPKSEFENPTLNGIRSLGYGLPLIERVTKNSETRITFYNTGTIKAEEGSIYSLQIPEELSDPGNEYDILIEVTLAYTAKVRRTRQKTKSYLSTWLDWTSSRLDDTLESFSKRSLTFDQDYVDDSDDSAQVIGWKIRERNNWGEVRDVNRNNSTIQKDWVVIKSYQLPREISFAIRAHKGWDRNKAEIPYAITVSIEVLNVNVPIYDLIRIENELEISIPIL